MAGWPGRRSGVDPDGQAEAGDAVRPHRPGRHRHRGHARHRPVHRRGLRVRPAPRSSSPAARPTPAPRPRPTSSPWVERRWACATHMGDLDGVQALVDATVDRFGRLDIVVNNAATALTLPLGQFTARGLGQVVRREPARAHLPRPGCAATSQGESVRRGGQRALCRCVPRVDERLDVLGGEGGLHGVHARAWRGSGRRSGSG